MKKISKKILSLVTAFAMIFTIFASPIGEIMGFMGDSVKASAATYNYYFPVKNGKLAYVYGYSEAYGGTHNGIDIHSTGDDTIYAAYSGVVEATANSCTHVSCGYQCAHYATFGNYIRIKQDDGTYAYYGHLLLNSLKVAVGDRVTMGQAIAMMGSSGYSTGKHLHFEVRTSTNSSTHINTNPVSSGGSVNYTYSLEDTSSYSTIASATYFIKNTSTNTYLSVDSGTDANTQNISVASKSNTNAFKWKFTNTSGKAYKIRPLCSTSRLLNPYGSTVVSGNNVNLYDDTDSTQWWYFETVDDGYVIRNYANSSCVLDISGTNVLVSTYVEGKQSQIWTLAPVDLVKPTITLDKSSYEVGDTVNISWAATPSSTNFSHYWLRVISPAGDNLVHKSMGNVNSYALTVTEEGTYTIIASTTPVGSPNGENSLVEGKTFEVGHEHTYTSKITKAATCTATGVRTYTCSKCGDSYTETIAKTGHNYSEVIVGSTFTQEGYSIYTCDDCGDTYTGGYFDKMTLPSIDSFALKSRNYNSITLSWTENVFATGYIIQQYKNNTWTNVANIKSNATTSYQITGLSANTSYKFRAVAYVTENGTTAYSSYTSALTVSTAPAMTTGFAITGRGSDFLTITWTKNTGASGYIIQEQVNGVWKNVASIKGNTTVSHKIANLQPNSFHRYRMVAYKTDANGTCYGKYTGSAPGYTAPAMVSNFKVSGIGADSLTVSWTKVASANGYVIDIYKDGKWSQLAKITSNATTSYKASGLTTGTTYKFRIKSYATNGTLTIYSTYSSAISGVPAISAPTNLTMTNRGTDFISVRWDKNADADGYMVYVYTNGSWLCVKTLTSNSAVSNRINGLESGTIYKIAVKSYKTVNGTRYVSGTTTISAVTL